MAIMDSVEISVNNASEQAIQKAQTAFKGAAERMGLSSEDDVQELINEIRYEKDK